MLTLLLETIRGWVLNHFVRKGNGEDTKAIIGRYNVLDYGLIPNNATKGNVNTLALRQMIADVPEGSVIYFPQGLYFLNDSIEINKSLSLVGDTHIKVDTSTESTTRSLSQIVLSNDFPANTTLFVRTVTKLFTIENLSFYAHRVYETIENSDEFTTLPYPFYKEAVSKENVNCLDISTDGIVSIQNCLFEGFSGYGIKVKHHRFVNNCGFEHCKIGIEVVGTDNWFNNCWFCRGGMAIHISDNNGTNTFTNLNVSNTWCDQMADHFIMSDITSGTPNMFILDNVWVDMIDKSAIYVPNSILKNCRINARFSRCGMMYAGLANTDRTAENRPFADVIHAYRVYNCEFNIDISKRKIGKGNNGNAVCPSKLISTSNHIVRETNIKSMTLYKADVTDIHSGGGFSDFGQCLVTCADCDSYFNQIWEYPRALVVERTSSPIGRITAPRVGTWCFDTTAKAWYRATAVNDNSAWEPLNLITRSEMEQYIQETDTIPTASADYVGKSYLYTGATTSTYQKGGIYECQEVLPSTSPATYHWVQIGVSTTQITELLSAITSATDFADLQSRLQGNAQS